MKSDMNRAVDVERTAKVGRKLAKEIHDFDDEQNKMRKIGTAHLVEVMDAYDLLPVHNFQYGNHPDTPKIASYVWEKRFTQGIFDGCWYGCHMACAKGADCHKVMTGPYQGHMVTVDGPEYETVRGPRRRTAASSTPTGSSSRTSTATPTASTPSRSAPPAPSRWSATSAAS